MHERVRQMIESFITEELQTARKKHKPMNSTHEAYGVIKEEVEELEEEIAKAKGFFDKMWVATRKDDRNLVIGGAEYMYYASVRAVGEALQMAAMARRCFEDLSGMSLEKGAGYKSLHRKPIREAFNTISFNPTEGIGKARLSFKPLGEVKIIVPDCAFDRDANKLHMRAVLQCEEIIVEYEIGDTTESGK
jgi:hypothetical protein